MSSYHNRATTLYRLIEAAPMKKAAYRARLFHNHVAWIGGRQFRVNASDGQTFYTVTFTDSADRKLCHCTCAGFEVNICRYIAAAYVLDFAIRAALRTRPTVKLPNIERRADGRVFCDGWQI